MLVSLAALAALCAGCGGGSEASTGTPSTPLMTSAAHAAPGAAALPERNDPVGSPMVADSGPIAPSDMDDEARAEIAATQQRSLHAADDESKEQDDAMVKAMIAAKAAEVEAAQAADGAPADSAEADDRDAAPMRAVALAANAGSRRGAPTPATTTTTTTTTTATTTSTSGTVVQTMEAIGARPVASTDIRLQVEASRLFTSYKWAWGMECAGQKAGAINIPEYGILGFDLGGGLGRTRFGKVPDPENSARQVLMFRPNSGDPLVSGAPRCEMTFSPNFGGKLPVNQHVWFAFGMRLKDWVATTDEQILMQWHWSNGSIPLGPFLALSLKGGKLQIDSKSNANYPPSASTTTSRLHWTNGTVTSNTWTYFVVKARISPHSSQSPYLKVWRDGVQVVNYAGPLGYNYPEVTPYLKIGHYQWVAAYNTWISAASTKTVLVRTPALITDPTGLYTEFDIRSHVRAR
jgi:hypothetical protein